MVGREKKDIKVSYKEYTERMKIRNEKAKPFNEWVRTIEKDGKKIQVAGESGETPEQKFKRLGTVRMRKALLSLKGIKNLASSQYKASPEQIEKINTTLSKACESIKDAFAGKVETEEKIEL